MKFVEFPLSGLLSYGKADIDYYDELANKVSSALKADPKNILFSTSDEDSDNMSLLDEVVKASGKSTEGVILIGCDAFEFAYIYDAGLSAAFIKLEDKEALEEFLKSKTKIS